VSLKKKAAPPGERSLDFLGPGKEVPVQTARRENVISFQRAGRSVARREDALAEKLLLEKAAKLHW
jgi:hypothetical protein